MNAKEKLPDPLADLKGEARQLLAGLLRQKEDLGPIAEELIELLQRYGVSDTGKPAVEPPVH